MKTKNEIKIPVGHFTGCKDLESLANERMPAKTEEDHEPFIENAVIANIDPNSLKSVNKEYSYKMAGSKTQHRADIMVHESNELVEYEVKRSFRDFQNDLNRKTKKHELLLKGKGPNRFYFVIPHATTWIKQILKYLESHKELQKYGLITAGDNKFQIVRTAQSLHLKKPTRFQELNMLKNQQKTILKYAKLLKKEDCLEKYLYNY